MAVVKRPWTKAEVDYLVESIQRDPDSADKVAEKLNRTRASVINKLAHLGVSRTQIYEASVTVSLPAKPGRTVAEYLAAQKDAHARKREYHEGKRRIPVTVDIDGPYGVALFGDLHGDDEGCDLGLFEHHCDTVKESGLPVLSFNLGDFTNNWVGKLSHLWAHQATTEGEGRKVIEYALGRIKWTAVILGNHDVWTPVCEMICNRMNIAAVTHGGKFYISSRDGQIVLDLAHHHRGSSMYNNAHGQTKRAYRGSDADIIAGAHIHSSGYHQTCNPETGKIGHAVRVSSYKVVDEYADRLGFGNEAISPCVFFVCDPSAEPHKRVRYFADPQDGIIFLRALRG
jgi:hypothetical protein